MTTITKYDILARRSGYPCADVTTYGWSTREITSLVQLAPQHRTKPASLLDSLTSLGLQYSDVRKCRIEHRLTPITLSCSGLIVPGSYEEWSVVMPTQDWPVKPQPSWEVAMRNKIQSDKLSFAENLGEWREAVDMVYDTSKTLRKAWRTIKVLWRQRKARRKYQAMFRVLMDRDWDNRFELQDVIAADLAIKFGVKPTIDQVFDVCEVLSRITACKRRLQVTVSADTEKTVPGRNGGAYAIRWERSYRAIAYVTYNWESSDFTAGNIGEALWAGTRLSFMVDWFLNIGSYLSSFNAMNGVTSLHGVLCDRQRVYGHDDRLDLIRGDGVTTSIAQPGTWARRSYQRTTFNSVPMASFPSPRLPDTGQWGKLLSSLEVLRSLRLQLKS